LRIGLTTIENKRFSVESGSLICTEMQTLKDSISKLTPPRMIEGFKASDSIQVFIPGCRPLSEGVISD
jgi:hypothetical protein